MRRPLLIMTLSLALLLWVGNASGSGVLESITLDWTDSAGAPLTVLQGSGTLGGLSYFPSTSGFNIADYEYFGYHFALNDASDSAVSVAFVIEVSSDGSNWDVYTQTCIYPIDASATATLTIADEGQHEGSLGIAPVRWLRIKATNANADVDVTPSVILNLK